MRAIEPLLDPAAPRLRIPAWFVVVLVLVAISGLTPSGFADYISPDTITVTTPSYTPEIKEPAEGLYEYEIGWQGISVANGWVKVEKTQKDGIPVYSIVASTQTTGIVKLFYSLKHRSESFVRADNFRPVYFESSQVENSRSRSSEISFAENGVVKSSISRTDRDRFNLEFSPHNLMLDPLSAAFLARTIPIQEGQVATFDVFNGRHRYLISFEVGQKEWVKLGNRSTLAYRVTPHVKKLTDSDGEQRIRSVTLWISADKNRDILKLESEVLIGSVQAKLRAFTPKPTGSQSPAVPEPPLVAKKLP